MNIFIRKIQSGEKINKLELKRYYHSLAKKIHPDVSQYSREAFNRLQNQYQEACIFLRQYNSRTNEEAKTQSIDEPVTKKQEDQKNPAYDFYRYFYYYTAVGLPSQNLKVRNDKRSRSLTSLILHYAIQYRDDLGQWILEYDNKCNINLSTEAGTTHLGSFYFYKGLTSFLWWQDYGDKCNYKLANSFLADAVSALPREKNNNNRELMIRLTNFFLEELKGEPVLFHDDHQIYTSNINNK